MFAKNHRFQVANNFCLPSLQKYLKNFESEKIGLAELVHLSEEQLTKLGIPMGPRIRIMQECKLLKATANGQQAVVNGFGKTQQLADAFNIYAIV